MSIETMTKLATVTVGSGGSSSIDFTNIPQTYTDLVIKYSGRNDSNNGTLLVKYNNDGVASNYLYIQVYGDGSAVNNDTQADLFFGVVTRSTFTASTFSSGEIYIPNYTSSNYKSVTTDSVSENNSTSVITSMWAGIWKNTAPISRITLSLYTGAFVQHSTATLYGIRNARRSAGNSIKATGGNISFDGTYVYHTFNSSGTFTPTSPLTADYLVVAGGGSGANAGTGGAGGGAGGLRSTIGFTGGGGSLEPKLYLLPTNTYAVTIGAGGSQPSYTNNGNNGSNSSFSTIISIGGGAGAQDDTNGFSGGSGGGAGGVGNRTGGAGTANQGYAGGNSLTGSPSNRPDGGGGGAGAVGGNGITNNSGSGGAGVQIKEFANATGAGTNSGYFAGGGGGGIGEEGSTAGTGGLGGGGNGNKVTGAQLATAGQPNTGGGGGGIDTQNGGGGSSAGGSGIVIIRYKA